MNDQQRRCIDWSSLPELILSLVLQHLNNTHIDRQRLRAVCTSWRSSLSPPPPPRLHFPLELTLPLYGKLHYYKSSILRHTVFYLISDNNDSSSANVWLARVEETLRASSSNSHPRNTWKLQKPLWSIVDDAMSQLPKLKEEVNLLDYRVSEVARSITSYVFVSDEDPVEGKMSMIPLSASSGASDVSLLALGALGNLIVSKSGARNWVTLPYEPVGDIISYGGKFYAKVGSKDIKSIDPYTFDVKDIVRPQREKHGFTSVDTNDYDGLAIWSYMVESCGNLYLVNKFFVYDVEVIGIPSREKGKPVKFEVFTLAYSRSPNGETKHFWEPVTNIGDRVFFLNELVCFSVLAQELGWSRGNCMFFGQDGSDYCYDEKCDHRNCSDYDKFTRLCGLYTFEDQQIITRDYLPSEYTNIFRPLPSLLSNN